MFRILIVMAVNLLVIITLGLLAGFLGIDHRYLAPHGLNLQALLIMAAFWGMAGSFISLLVSKFMAKMALGVHVLDPQDPGSSEGRQLVETVRRLCEKAGMSSLPEIGIYESPEVNAFATGASSSSALVAVSTGLLNSMDDR